MKKNLVAALVATFMVCLPLSAQNAKINLDQLDKQLSKQAVVVSQDGLKLTLAKKAAAKADPKIGEDLKDVEGIYVRTMELKEGGPSLNEAIEPIKRQINEAPWTPMAPAVKLVAGETINVSECYDPSTKKRKGVGVLVVQNGKLVLINIVGDFPSKKLDKLKGKFGIPDWLNFGGDNN